MRDAHNAQQAADRRAFVAGTRLGAITSPAGPPARPEPRWEWASRALLSTFDSIYNVLVVRAVANDSPRAPSDQTPGGKALLPWKSVILESLPLTRPLFVAMSVLGALYLFRYCSYFGLPYPTSLMEIGWFAAVLFALAAYGTTIVLAFLILPSLVQRAPFNGFLEYAVKIVIPVVAFGAAVTFTPEIDAPYHAVVVLSTVAVVTLCIAVRRRRGRFRAPRHALQAVWALAVFVVCLFWLTVTLTLAMALLPPLDAATSSVLIVAIVLMLLVVLFRMLKQARLLRVVTSAYRLVGAIMLVLIGLALLPAPAAPHIARTALRELGVGGDVPIRFALKESAAKTALPELGYSEAARKTCRLFLVLESAGTYFVRATLSDDAAILSIPSSEVAHTLRGPRLAAVECPSAANDASTVRK